jgi:DNA-binding transcriptional LysR family regulator
MDLLLAMRVFVRVVECGGLSTAGRALGLGQPAVSERLRQLERHLGARLLDRNTRSARVTDIGAVFYARAKAALEAADEATASIATFNRQLRGTLRIAAPHALGEVVVAPLLATLHERHPELSIDLILNDRFVDPVIEGVDVSIRVGRLGEGSFVARSLGRVRRALLASPGYLARAGVPGSPAALAAHPFIHIDGLARDGKLLFDSPQGMPVTARVRSAWRCNHWRPLLAALLAGNGIGVLHRPVCRHEIATGQLVPVLADHALPDLPVHAIYPASRRVPAKTGAVVAWLQTQLPALLDEDDVPEQSA